MAYRVSRRRDAIRVEGRAGSRTCVFGAGKPNGVARLMPAAVWRRMSSHEIAGLSLPAAALKSTAGAAGSRRRCLSFGS